MFVIFYIIFCVCVTHSLIIMIIIIVISAVHDERVDVSVTNRFN